MVVGHFALLGPHPWTTVTRQEDGFGWRKVVETTPTRDAVGVTRRDQYLRACWMGQ